jgi:hypothetical protein
MFRTVAMFIATHYRHKHLDIVMNITGFHPQAHTTRSNCFTKGCLNLLISRPHKVIHKFMRPLSPPISESLSSPNYFRYLPDCTVTTETQIPLQPLCADNKL